MSDTILRRLAKALGERPKMAGKPATDVEINDAEAALGVTFVPVYREFLRTFGAAVVGSDPILGLSRVEAMDEDLWSVVDVTLRFREQRMPGAEDWYIVCVDGVGNPLGVDRAGRVWCFDLDVDQKGLVAESFEEYLEELAASL